MEPRATGQGIGDNWRMEMHYNYKPQADHRYFVNTFNATISLQVFSSLFRYDNLVFGRSTPGGSSSTRVNNLGFYVS